MKNTQRILTTLLLVSAGFLQACASGEIKDSDRDTSGVFDGVYSMNVKKMAGLQYVENWNMNCNGQAYTTELVVKDGRAMIKPTAQNNNVFPTNIDKQGRFRLVIPLRSKAKATGASATTMADGRRRLIIDGNLSKGSGSFVVGIKQFGWQGCRANVKYIRDSSSKASDQA